jgi:hypothetical protein
MDDDITWEVEGPGLWRFTCANPAHGESYSWLTTGRDRHTESGNEGICNDLHLYEDLLRCVIPGEAYLEYGVIEYRYALANPETYKKLVSTYSHTALGETPGYSASALIGGALGKLPRDGLLVRVLRKSTGYWSYNGQLNTYALSPGPTDEATITWAGFATDLDLDPNAWPAELLP